MDRVNGRGEHDRAWVITRLWHGDAPLTSPLQGSSEFLGTEYGRFHAETVEGLHPTAQDFLYVCLPLDVSIHLTQ